MFKLKDLFKRETEEDIMTTNVEDKVLVTCASCGTVNRVEKEKLQANPTCGNCKAELKFFDKPVVATTQTFKQEVEEQKGLVLVDFWATWCPPCKMIAPILESISKEKAGAIKIVKVDVDKEPYLSRRFAISSIPTLILFKDGKEVKQMAGAMPKAQLLNWIFG